MQLNAATEVWLELIVLPKSEARLRPVFKIQLHEAVDHKGFVKCHWELTKNAGKIQVFCELSTSFGRSVFYFNPFLF